MCVGMIGLFWEETFEVTMGVREYFMITRWKVVSTGEEDLFKIKRAGSPLSVRGVVTKYEEMGCEL